MKPADYVRGRNQVVCDADWSGTGAHVVDADRPPAEVVDDFKTLMWSAS